MSAHRRSHAHRPGSRRTLGRAWVLAQVFALLALLLLPASIVLGAAPAITVTFPAAATTYTASTWDDGCTTVAEDFCGSVTSAGTVTGVEWSLRRGTTSGNYWDGTGFTSASEVFFPTTSTFTVGFAFANFPADGTYRLHIHATQSISPTDGNLNRDFGINTGPTVTINQKTSAPAQADPTKGSPINFTVVFNETVTNFATGDVDLTDSTTGGVLVGTVTGSGTTYNVAVSGMAADGNVIAKINAGVATDASGNPNFASTSTDNTVTYDLSGPAAPTITVSPASPDDDKTPTWSFTGAEGGGTFQCQFTRAGSGTPVSDWSACTSPKTFNIGGGPDDTYTFHVRQIDAAGNTGAAADSSGYVLDTAAPPKPVIDSGPDDPTNVDDATFTFHDTEDGVTFTCSLDGAAFTSCSSGQSYNDLTDGEHTFAVKASDAVPNASGATNYTWTIDTIDPTVTIDTGPNDPTTSTSAAFTFTPDDLGGTPIVSTECDLDNGGFVACDSTTGHSYAGPLGTGSHTFTVKVTDEAGNEGTDTWTWTINADDTTDPVVTLDNPADASTTNDDTPTFDGDCGTETGDDATVSVKIYEGTDTSGTLVDTLAADCIAGAYTVDATTPLADGTYTAQAEQGDEAGNTGTSSANTFTVDTTPEGMTLTSLSDVHAWLSLRNTDDISTNFDLRVELLKNGSVVASGLERCITGLTRASETEAVVEWDAFTPVSVESTDNLAIRISTRIGTNADDTKCGTVHSNATGLRLYYDSTAWPTRFDMTIDPASSVDEYLHSDGTACTSAVTTGITDYSLTTTAPATTSGHCVDSGGVNFAGGNAWSTIGTWDMDVP
jgi:hypothetical protein